MRRFGLAVGIQERPCPFHVFVELLLDFREIFARLSLERARMSIGNCASEQSPELPILFLTQIWLASLTMWITGLAEDKHAAHLNVEVMVTDRQADDLGQPPLGGDHFAHEGVAGQIPFALDVDEGADRDLRSRARSRKRSGSI